MNNAIDLLSQYIPSNDTTARPALVPTIHTADLRRRAYASAGYLQGCKTLADVFARIPALHYAVEARGISLVDGAKITSHKAIVRVDNNHVLSVQSHRYSIIQNAEAFAPLEHMVATGDAEFVDGGIVDEGGRAWLRLAMNHEGEVRRGDVVRTELVVSNSHNGSGAWSCWIRPLRLACLNGAVLPDAQQTLFSFRHTRGVSETIALMKQLKHRVVRTMQEVFDLYGRMAQTRLQSDAVWAVLDAVAPLPTDTDAKRAIANAERTRALVLDLVRTSPGAELVDPQSAWALFNGVTYWTDHVRPVDLTDERAAKQVLFGEGERLKQAALEALLRYL